MNVYAELIDKSTYYEIASIENDDDIFLKSGKLFLPIDPKVANYVNSINKNGNVATVLKGTTFISFGSITVVNNDPLEQAKKLAIRKIQRIIDGYTTIMSMVEVFEYVMLNNIFVEQGIFISDTNREEKYLEIINTGNEELISNLERFLELKDKVSQYITLINKISQFRNEVYSLTTVEEVNALRDSYLLANSVANNPPT